MLYVLKFKDNYTENFLLEDLLINENNDKKVEIGENMVVYREGKGTIENGIIVKIIEGSQINPHETEKNCKYYFDKNLIIGCGKPFRLEKDVNGQIKFVNKCDYI